MEILNSIVIDVLALIVTLGILVTIHEYGHLWVARRCGVKIEKFSIGFGRPLYKWQRGETTFQIAMIPLGGYVKMLGEQDEDIAPEEKHRAFNAKPVGQRAAIAAAGPLANFILAVALYWIMFISGVSDYAPVIGKVTPESPAAIAGIEAGSEILAIDGSKTNTWQEVYFQLLGRLGESGEVEFELKKQAASDSQFIVIPIQDWLIRDSNPEILSSLGIREYRLDIPPVLDEITPGGRAQEAGLRSGDEIVAVNGNPVEGWLDWRDLVLESPERELSIDYIRSGARQQLILVPELMVDEEGESVGRVGAGVLVPEVQPQLPEYMLREIRYNPIAALPQAMKETWKNIVFVLVSIKKMIVGLISVENLSGPLTIAQVAGDTVSYGLEYFLGFLAILSISLGVLNLLPIPVLDGGHLFYYAIEALIRRPVPEKIQAIGMQFGLLLIAGIMLLAFYNDVNRLF